jgi:nitrate/nitrite transport system ATP-binding protein
LAKTTNITVRRTFGVLDSSRRGKLQEDVLLSFRQRKTTGIMITHDVDESIFLADR